MTGEQKYQVYKEMCSEIEVLEPAIRKHFEETDRKVYCCFLAVQDEEKRQFFVDIEVGGSPEKYNRWRGEFTKEQLIKGFSLQEV